MSITVGLMKIVNVYGIKKFVSYIFISQENWSCPIIFGLDFVQMLVLALMDQDMVSLRTALKAR